MRTSGQRVRELSTGAVSTGAGDGSRQPDREMADVGTTGATPVGSSREQAARQLAVDYLDFWSGACDHSNCSSAGSEKKHNLISGSVCSSETTSANIPAGAPAGSVQFRDGAGFALVTASPPGLVAVSTALLALEDACAGRKALAGGSIQGWSDWPSAGVTTMRARTVAVETRRRKTPAMLVTTAR